MDFVNLNRSDVMDVIRDINHIISNMSSELDGQIQIAHSASIQARKFRQLFSVPGSVLWSLYATAADLNYSAGSRTHDIELVINEAQGQRLVGQVQFLPFKID